MSLSINQQIAASRMLNLEELIELNNFIVSRIKEKRSYQSRLVKRKLFEGARVSFENNAGLTVSGEVTKVMRKFAKVQVGSDTWRVPMSMLTVE